MPTQGSFPQVVQSAELIRTSFSLSPSCCCLTHSSFFSPILLEFSAPISLLFTLLSPLDNKITYLDSCKFQECSRISCIFTRRVHNLILCIIISNFFSQFCSIKVEFQLVVKIVVFLLSLGSQTKIYFQVKCYSISRDQKSFCVSPEESTWCAI